MTELKHISVLLKESIDGLEVKNNGLYFDGTLGGGGHTLEILKRSTPEGKVVATDLDEFAINKSKERLKEYLDRVTFVLDNFKNFSKIKENLGIEGFDGIILDLGVSSFQIDDRSRGFSYLDNNAELDMRMSKENPLTAKSIVNNYQEKDLIRIFKEYGEERFSSIIARNIVERRKKNPINTVGDLIEIILNSIPKKFQHEGHPAKRVFQALRIEVNGELEGLEQTIKDMVHGLKKGGRISIITFHSLEDRIVKQTFKDLETDCICDKSLPVCVCGKKKEIEIITKHPIIAGEQELNDNPRSKSAKLRIAQRI